MKIALKLICQIDLINSKIKLGNYERKSAIYKAQVIIKWFETEALNIGCLEFWRLFINGV